MGDDKVTDHGNLAEQSDNGVISATSSQLYISLLLLHLDNMVLRS